MKYDRYRHNRHSIRLPGYDYAAPGTYFITVCLNQRIRRGQTWQTKGQPRGVAPAGTERGYDFPTFGLVENGVMVLNDSGKMVQQIWNEMPKYYPGVELGEFIVMPDHIHGIIKINDPPVGATPRGCPYGTNNKPNQNNKKIPISLPYLMDCFKTMTTTKYINGVKTSKWKPFHKRLWQRNYWERIIRNEAEYARIAEYIRNNAVLWDAF